ncbi:uncharacterized protein LOC133034321 [Cannabis sativa]|uniref:uncharacterized protein LOC133034321 n=1 Tax=Cannabis sativa TaxID=3483 RepID=UPI0029CA7C63|nr:uncharacterized protein LOC133034321 [Cannabis sativa]
MGLQLNDLTPCLQPVYGFSGQRVAPLGQIHLPLTVGQAPTSMTIMAHLLILDVPSAFNVMLGRPAWYDLKVVTLIFHSCLKFLAKNGVGCLRGNQQSARKYMVGIDPSIISHVLNIDPNFRPVQQKQRLLDKERALALKEEVEKLRNNNFIIEAFYPAWVANPILVPKPKKKW